MKKIKLTQGKCALVDNADFEWLSQWKWCAVKPQGIWYAVRKAKGYTVRMHREILGLRYKDGKLRR